MALVGLDQLAASDMPDGDAGVFATCRKIFAVGRPVHCLALWTIGVLQTTIGHVPDLVICGKVFAIRRPGQTVGSGVERREDLAAGQRPNLSYIVPVAERNAFAVRRPGYEPWGRCVSRRNFDHAGKRKVGATVTACNVPKGKKQRASCIMLA